MVIQHTRRTPYGDSTTVRAHPRKAKSRGLSLSRTPTIGNMDQALKTALFLDDNGYNLRSILKSLSELHNPRIVKQVENEMKKRQGAPHDKKK